MAIILLDAAIMIYVNLKNDSEAVEFYLAIPCAIVGIIVFWCYLIRGGELGHTLGKHSLDPDDESKSKAGNVFKGANFLKLFSSKFLQNKEGDAFKKGIDRNHVTSIKSVSSNEGSHMGRGYVLKD